MPQWPRACFVLAPILQIAPAHPAHAQYLITGDADQDLATRPDRRQEATPDASTASLPPACGRGSYGAEGTVCADPCGGGPLPGCVVCGDGILRGAEECDGTNLRGRRCASFGFDAGILTCSSSCSFDLAGCCCTDGTPGCPPARCAAMESARRRSSCATAQTPARRPAGARDGRRGHSDAIIVVTHSTTWAVGDSDGSGGLATGPSGRDPGRPGRMT